MAHERGEPGIALQPGEQVEVAARRLCRVGRLAMIRAVVAAEVGHRLASDPTAKGGECGIGLSFRSLAMIERIIQ